MIEQICQYCGKEFMARPDKVKKGESRFCSHFCHLKHRHEPPIMKHCLECGKEIITTRYRLSRGQGKFCSKECRIQSPLTKQRQSEASRKRWQNPSYRQHLVDVNKKNWQNPAWVKKMLSALNVKPTKPELQLQAILDKHFSQFKYNGDGRLGVTLGGQTPDFVNIDGRKDLIEVFGDYYHSPEVLKARWQGSELGKIMIYNSLGWKCLIIWASELTDEQAVISKIKRFVKTKRSKRWSGNPRI